jgi:nuclease S1
MAGMTMPGPALAWGADGHRLVAELAGRQLSAPAKADLERLLSQEPGSTLESISTWPDENRSPATSAWHYVNLPRDSNCTYDAARSCIQGMCVVGAIERQAAVLASDAPDEARLKALKYVVHFVADVHQPLHGGFADDRGGNSFQLQAFGRGTNLHALWDSGLIGEWPGGIPSLRAALLTSGDRTKAAFSPGAWAEESCRVVRSDGFYPASHKLDPEYPTRWSATLAARLSAAGERLGQVLNESLGAR